MFTKETVKQILEETKYKPSKYLHQCTGGASKGCDRINFWSGNAVEQCKHSGDDNWICPWCKTCDGKHDGWSKLTDQEERRNRGMEELAAKLIERLEEDVKGEEG